MSNENNAKRIDAGFELFLDPGFDPSLSGAYQLDGSVVSVQSSEFADDDTALKIVFQGTRDDGKVATFETGSFFDQPSESGKIERHDICVSTAGGCTRSCNFCSVPNAELGFERLLTEDEIIFQSLYSMRLRNPDNDFANIVGLMGNGEPPDNIATIGATKRLASMGVGVDRITISTIGENIANLKKMREEFRGLGVPVGLQLSLHSADESIRRKFVPGRASLDAVMRAVDSYTEETGVLTKLNVVLMEGTGEFEGVSNTSVEQAKMMASLVLSPSYASGNSIIRTLKLSAYNNVPGISFDGPSAERMQDYIMTLESEGVAGMQFFVGSGRDIDADQESGGFACGQLRATTQKAEVPVALTRIPVNVHSPDANAAKESYMAQLVEETERESSWRSNRVLYVSGEHAAGKSSIIAACELEGYTVVDMGPILTKLYEKRAGGLSWKEWIIKEEHDKGTTFVADLIADHIQSSEVSENGTIIIGPRSPEVIERLEEVLNPSDSRTVYVSASYQNMYSRYKMREGSVLSEDEFDEKLAYDIDLGVRAIRDGSVLQITNDGPMSDQVNAVTKMLNEWKMSNA